MSMAGAGRGALRVAGMCRGEGVGYVALWSVREMGDLQAHAHLGDGTPVPCNALPVKEPRELRILDARARCGWVVVVPLLGQACVIELTPARGGVCAWGYSPNADSPNARVSLQAGTVRIVFPPHASKVWSRAMGVLRPELTALMRGFEWQHGSGKPSVVLRDVWPGENGRAVWRIVATFPMADSGAVPRLEVCDSSAGRVDAEIVVMEDQLVPSVRDASMPTRIITFSCTLPEDLRSFYAVAVLEDPEGLRGFAGMNAPRAAGMLADTRRMISGAAYDEAYAAWFAGRRVTEAELDWQRSRVPEKGPLISVMCACEGSAQEDTPQNRGHLECAPAPDSAIMASLQAQSYTRWEIGDGGDYVLIAQEGDVLESDALWHLAQEVLKKPEADMLYWDEDVFDGEVMRDPWFKRFPNYGDMYTRNAVGHAFMASRSAFSRAVALGPLEVGAEAYDLALRLFETARKVVHVSRVLLHACNHGEPSFAIGQSQGTVLRDGDAHEAGRRALSAHLCRREISASVTDGPLPGTYHVGYKLPDSRPLVSIVIPTRDQAQLLGTCVSSLLERSTYENLEVVLVENNSSEATTFALYDDLCARDERVRVVVWEPQEPGAFNYSAIVNHGVRHSAGEYVVLLNNDTEVLEPTWLEEMLGSLMRPEVGVVGAKLLFYDGLIQHVGMVANPNGDNCHVFQNLTPEALGAGGQALMPGDYSMVTGACQMTRRALFDELGGYDEELAVGFNDTDYCLRVREAGYAVTMAARAVLRHREFSTRGRELTDVRLRARQMKERAYTMGRHAEFYAQGDPALNPNLNPFGAYGELGW